MFENEIIDPGKKVFEIRKKILKVPLKAIAKNDMTASLVSKIERGDVTLTENTGKKIYKNIKKISTDKNITVDITLNNLVEPVKNQCSRILNTIIDEYNSCKFENHTDEFWESKVTSLKEIIDNTEDLKEKALSCEFISHIYLKRNNVDESAFYNALAIGFYNDNNDPNAVRVLVSFLKNYKDNPRKVIDSARRAYFLYSKFHLQDNTMLKKIFFNIAVSYSQIKLFELSIEYLEKLLSLNTDFEKKELVWINILKAHCLMFLGYYDKCEEINLKTLSLSIKEDFAFPTATIYIHLAELCRNKKDLIKGNAYIEKALKIERDISSEEHSQILYNVAIHYIECENIDAINEYVYPALISLKENNNNKDISELLSKTMNYFNKNNKLKDIENLSRNVSQIFGHKRLIKNGHTYICHEI